MATIATFETRVSRALKRGNVFDADIPTYAKDAIRTLEDLCEWRHMWTEEFGETLAAGENTIELEDVRNVRYVRFHIDSAGRFQYVKKVSADQIAYVDDGPSPSGFYMLDRNTIAFDSKPSENLTYDVGYFKYSSYDDDLPWLTIAEALLVAQTIVEMTALHKDDKVRARFESYISGRVQALIEAGVASEFDGQDQRMIPYADEMDEWLISGVEY